MATLFIILCLIRTTLACWGASGEEGGGKGGGTTDPKVLGNLSDPTKTFINWAAPPSGDHSIIYYTTFIKEYQANEERKIKEALIAAGGSWPERPADAGPDWPKDWNGLGPGLGGVTPPPWAYVKESSGKADMCFLPPVIGDCQEFSKRWGFNAYKDDCDDFIYSGCGGNENNFMSKKRCLEACVGVPSGNCVSGSDLILDSSDFDDIPKPNF